MATNRTLKIGYRVNNTNIYDSYIIPEYVKLIIGDTNGIEYTTRNPIYLAINITTGETTSFHTRNGRAPAEEFITGREKEFHLLECEITEYLDGHNKIEPWIEYKYKGDEQCSPETNCYMDEIEIPDDLDIRIGDKVFVCSHSSKYYKDYYTKYQSRGPDFTVAKTREFFTSNQDMYQLRGLAELKVD